MGHRGRRPALVISNAEYIETALRDIILEAIDIISGFIKFEEK
jgi:hypothetical protein